MKTQTAVGWIVVQNNGEYAPRFRATTRDHLESSAWELDPTKVIAWLDEKAGAPVVLVPLGALGYRAYIEVEK